MLLRTVWQYQQPLSSYRLFLIFNTTTCHFGKIRIIFHFSVTFYTKSDFKKRVSLAVVIEVT